MQYDSSTAAVRPVPQLRDALHVRLLPGVKLDGLDACGKRERGEACVRKHAGDVDGSGCRPRGKDCRAACCSPHPPGRRPALDAPVMTSVHSFTRASVYPTSSLRTLASFLPTCCASRQEAAGGGVGIRQAQGRPRGPSCRWAHTEQQAAAPARTTHEGGQRDEGHGDGEPRERGRPAQHADEQAHDD